MGQPQPVAVSVEAQLQPEVRLLAVGLGRVAVFFRLRQPDLERLLIGLKITNFPGFFEGGRIHLLYVVVSSSVFILLVVNFQLDAE